MKEKKKHVAPTYHTSVVHVSVFPSSQQQNKPLTQQQRRVCALSKNQVGRASVATWLHCYAAYQTIRLPGCAGGRNDVTGCCCCTRKVKVRQRAALVVVQPMLELWLGQRLSARNKARVLLILLLLMCRPSVERVVSWQACSRVVAGAG